MNGFRHSDDKGPKRVCPFASLSLSFSAPPSFLPFHPKNLLSVVKVQSAAHFGNIFRWTNQTTAPTPLPDSIFAATFMDRHPQRCSSVTATEIHPPTIRLHPSVRPQNRCCIGIENRSAEVQGEKWYNMI